jgi:hypothetical protein
MVVDRYPIPVLPPDGAVAVAGLLPSSFCQTSAHTQGRQKVDLTGSLVICNNTSGNVMRPTWVGRPANGFY